MKYLNFKVTGKLVLQNMLFICSSYLIKRKNLNQLLVPKLDLGSVKVGSGEVKTLTKKFLSKFS